MMVDIVTMLLRVADAMEHDGGYPRSVPLMRDAADEIMVLREENKELSRRWKAFRKRRAQVGRNAKRQDPQGLGPKDEHAVGGTPMGPDTAGTWSNEERGGDE